MTLSKIGISSNIVYIPNGRTAGRIRGQLDTAWRELIDTHSDSEVLSLRGMTVEVIINAVRCGK